MSVKDVTALCIFIFTLMSSRCSSGDTVTVGSSCPTAGKSKLLLISLDGFRWDYLTLVKTPNFDRIIHNGVKASRGVINAFTTITLPNHYTIVTGLYEESHGLVANMMYDNVFHEVFNLQNKTQQSQSKWFDNGGEPVWVTNQMQSTCHRSGAYMWPGSAAAVKGFLPYIYQTSIHTIDFRQRIDTVISWFTGTYPVNLGLLYFYEPDECGHMFGPGSKEIIDMIVKLDSDVGYLLSQLEKNHLHDMNIIITSDHGMTATPEAKTIDLDQYVDPTLYQIYQPNPVGNILPNNGREAEVFAKLKIASRENGHFKIYWKKDIPEEYHYHDNRRIQPILVVADEHYTLTSHHYNGTHSKGNHGYNNSLPDMHPFFLAMGPAFKPGASVETFNNVDIYPLMCHILQLKPAPNNGSLENVRALLKDEGSGGGIFVSCTSIFYIVILLFITCNGVMLSVAACRVQWYHKRLWTVHFKPLGPVDASLNNSTSINNEKSPMLESSEKEDLIP